MTGVSGYLDGLRALLDDYITEIGGGDYPVNRSRGTTRRGRGLARPSSEARESRLEGRQKHRSLPPRMGQYNRVNERANLGGYVGTESQRRMHELAPHLVPAPSGRRRSPADLEALFRYLRREPPIGGPDIERFNR